MAINSVVSRLSVSGVPDWTTEIQSTTITPVYQEVTKVTITGPVVFEDEPVFAAMLDFLPIIGACVLYIAR